MPGDTGKLRAGGSRRLRVGSFFERLFKNSLGWYFPGGAVVETLCFHCRRHKFSPRQGIKIWHAAGGETKQIGKKTYCLQPSLARALQHLTPGKITPFKIRKRKSKLIFDLTEIFCQLVNCRSI